MRIEDKLLDLLQKVILEETTIKDGIDKFNKYVKHVPSINLSKINCIKRSIVCFENIKNDKPVSDFLSNIRQVILTYNRRIEVGNSISEEIFYSNNIFKDMYIYSENGRKFLNAIPLEKDIYSKDFYSVYNFDENYNSNEYIIGDQRLKAMTKFKGYRSRCQKFIVRALENQLEGTTILATLPTGGGKSLVGQFISYYEGKGTTIVVVPTVALAIDQSRSSEQYFKGDRVVRAYYDGVEEDDMKNILNELKSGKIAMLYLSPESIMNGKFNEGIVEATSKGVVTRLLIDEAHIIAEWGEFFRTEFQFLSVFRRKLLEINKGLKTVLLSATVTENTEKVLKILYSESNNFIQIRGDSLRNEIIYYKYKCKSEEERNEKLVEVVSMLPRALIIYVPTIEKAKEYDKLLASNGFTRTRVFTSETSSEERRKILDYWNDNSIDIIIATSAFGMGVDKKDVRAVVHTFIPENIDRFYQEVGRGGRDGYNSLSIVLSYMREDSKYIQYFTRNKVLTIENFIERWKTIFEKESKRISGDEIWVSVNAAPDRLENEGPTGKLNKSWNEYVLLLLYRYGIIDIKQVSINKGTLIRELRIKLLNFDLINNLDKMKEKMEPILKSERLRIDEEINNMKEMIQKNSKCWSKYFRSTYYLTSEKCNGCPYCRAKNTGKYFLDDYFEIIENDDLIEDSFLKERNGKTETLIVRDNDYITNFKTIFNECSKKEIDCILIPDEISLEYFDWGRVKKNKIFIYYSSDILKNKYESYIGGNVALLFDNNDINNDKIFKYLNELKSKERIKKLVLIARNDIFIKSEGKTLSNVAEGLISYLGGK